jgi:2,4-dienoyl-CoA reductase-like NADH-dependent reductase (Old Yellow Enzyme family)
MTFPRMASFASARQLRRHAALLGFELPCDDTAQAAPDGPLARPYTWRGGVVGNRFAVLPMEGWDGTPDGRPSELTRRRWQRFGQSGAKLVWGGEAVAVRPDGRANPNQLLVSDENLAALEALRGLLVAAHGEAFGRTDDLLVGLQLTHSGRFAHPQPGAPTPRVLYHHPCLDGPAGAADDCLLDDADVSRLVEDFVQAARLAQKAGFAFVDIKHCHGYLGHEFLSAVDRPGRYGGSLQNRTRFLREVLAGIRAEAPGLEVGVRVSVFDSRPFRAGPDGRGEPVPWPGSYRYAFGGDAAGAGIDLAEPMAFLEMLEQLGVHWVCTTAGSPYYNPHLQRPAAYPPSDGYLPPEDPLAGVARQFTATATLKRRFPQLAIVGSGYSYLQEWLPHVAQAVVRTGGADFVGLGRMALAYPELPADVLAGRPLQRRRLCRTFSDCTTGPRNGLVSGCYPLDPFYHSRPEQLHVARLRLDKHPPRGAGGSPP